jgi:hypothetical protein
MKEIKEYINESNEWNPSLDSHKVAYNNFVKWYDKCLKHLNKEEILDLLNGAIKEIEDDSLDVIK